MRQDEKDRLLGLFDDQRRWCREVDARDDQGNAVHYDDPAAVAWDIVGGMCHLFGWRRACELFAQMTRHVVGSPPGSRWSTDPQMLAMAALQDFNDRPDTTFELVVAKLREAPVWSRKPSSEAPAPIEYAPSE